ncbi:MAG TPA: metal-dependent hydrolase [Candidatus Lokiarchaeia archaeon]
MDFISHFFLGFLISALTVNFFGLNFFIFASIMSIVPDFDVFLHPLSKRKKNYFLSHRGGSHSYVIGLMISPIAGGIFYLVTNQNYFLAVIVAFIFYAIHVTFDLFTTSKIPIFFPLSKKEYRLSVDRAVNSILLMFSTTNVAIFLILYFICRRAYYSAILWIVYFIMYSTYFIYKIITRIWVEYKLPENCEFIPGVLPFVYFIYGSYIKDNCNVFRLTKKFQFTSKKKKIAENSVKMDSKENFYFEKAKHISKEYRFFQKWNAIIPIIQTNKDTVEVTLFLAESYVNGVAYSVKVVFNKNNSEIIQIYNGFNKIYLE